MSESEQGEALPQGKIDIFDHFVDMSVDKFDSPDQYQ
jgi:hypothetical protein